MSKLIANILLGFLAFYLASIFVPGVTLKGDFGQQMKILLFAGTALGLINYFIKPIIDVITFPVKLITLGSFSLLINMIIVWFIDVYFPGLNIVGLAALFWTGLIVWLVTSLVGVAEKVKK